MIETRFIVKSSDYLDAIGKRHNATQLVSQENPFRR
jgi:hypothetical protein